MTTWPLAGVPPTVPKRIASPNDASSACMGNFIDGYSLSQQSQNVSGTCAPADMLNHDACPNGKRAHTRWQQARESLQRADRVAESGRVVAGSRIAGTSANLGAWV